LKYDRAYSSEYDKCLTIYEIRELNFDEEVDYNSEDDEFFCPDDDCRLNTEMNPVLTTVNANKVTYKKTPHFKDIPSTTHRLHCPYGETIKESENIDGKSSYEEGFKTTDFPTVFLLERKKYTKKSKSKDETVDSINKTIESQKSTGKLDNTESKKSPNTTSVFEHIVECFLSNQHDKDKLKSMPLTISDVTANYNFFFKNIRYFQDREGLIYWGRIKNIKDYKYSFAITFADQVSNTQITAYINKSTIDNYRKKRYFTEKIRSLNLQNDDFNCFFFGAYPEIKHVEHGDKSFDVYNIDINNLDHFLLRLID
jgi:hypothetical protein